MWPGVTGVESPLGVPEIIDLALRLHPDTEAVAVITNVVGVDNDWLLAERAALLRYRDKVREIDLVGPPSPELLQKVAALPPHTVVLFQLFPQDSDQLAFGAFDVLASVAQRLPTYSILPLLDRGAVGAATYDATNDAVLAGQLAARVLVWRASRRHSRCAELPCSAVRGLATASPMEHSGIGTAAGHSCPVP